MDGGPWHCTGDRDQDHPQEKEMQKSKMAAWRGLTKSCEKKWKAKRKRKDIPILIQNSKKSQGDKKAFLNKQCKETEENNRMGKTRDLFKKIRDTKEHFMQRWAQ